MTEPEFNVALSSGAASVSPDDSATAEPEGGAAQPVTPSYSLSQFLPILLALQSTQNFLTAAPTFVPQTFQDQLQFVYTGGNYYLYLYFNNQWNSIQLGASSGAPVTGISGAMSGGGIVTVHNPAITTSSIIIFSRNFAGGTLGDVSIFGGGPSAGQFTLSSSSSSDTSTFNYAIYN